MLFTGESQTFQLADGRRLGYAEFGPQQGDPVFYFHGLSGARIEAVFSLKSARRTNTRLIAVDRPGFGLSTFAPHRHLYDWPDDISALADALGIKRFSVLGVSTGGPYALACAHKIPQRVKRVGISGSLAPLAGTNLLKRMHWLSRGCFSHAQRGGLTGQLLYGCLLGLLTRLWPRQLPRLLALCGSKADQRSLQRSSGRSRAWFASVREACREGLAGPYYDLSLVARPWGFAIDEIALPVRIWHGQEDGTIPMAMSRYLVEHIPTSQACFVRGEGHFSMISNHINNALLQLKAS